MKPPRKRRSRTFDLPPATPPVEAPPDWAYRSDAVRVPSPPAPPESHDVRSLPERTIAAFARPFEIALVLLLLPFGRKRGSRSDAALLLIVVGSLAMMTMRCRAQEANWSGVEEAEDGYALKVAAPEPECGCLTLTSKVHDPVTVQAHLKNVVQGRSTIPAAGRLESRFDWAGEENDDVYFLRANVNGRPVKVGTALSYARSGWVECTQAKCGIGPLMMNGALAAGH